MQTSYFTHKVNSEQRKTVISQYEAIKTVNTKLLKL